MDQPNLLLSVDHVQPQMFNAKHLVHFEHEMSMLIDVSFSGDNRVENRNLTEITVLVSEMKVA